ncbi:MAG: hypothetical protein U9O98_10300 [Asgard group archaeon]|nr:hypothetical protein [Asgard group archaeon]
MPGQREARGISIGQRSRFGTAITPRTSQRPAVHVNTGDIPSMDYAITV